MKIHIKMFFKLLFHKLCVLRAGLWTKAPLWLLLIHDRSKFYPSEFPHYARKHVGKDHSDKDGYLRCWVHHQNRNPHHWEHWVSRPKSSIFECPELNFKPAPMPMKYVREMIADWMGASRTYEGYWPNVHDWVWVDINLPDMILHTTTKQRIKLVIDGLREIKSLKEN